MTHDEIDKEVVLLFEKLDKHIEKFELLITVCKNLQNSLGRVQSMKAPMLDDAGKQVKDAEFNPVWIKSSPLNPILGQPVLTEGQRRKSIDVVKAELAKLETPTP